MPAASGYSSTATSRWKSWDGGTPRHTPPVALACAGVRPRIAWKDYLPRRRALPTHPDLRVDVHCRKPFLRRLKPSGRVSIPFWTLLSCDPSVSFMLDCWVAADLDTCFGTSGSGGFRCPSWTLVRLIPVLLGLVELAACPGSLLWTIQSSGSASFGVLLTLSLSRATEPGLSQLCSERGELCLLLPPLPSTRELPSI